MLILWRQVLIAPVVIQLIWSRVELVHSRGVYIQCVICDVGVCVLRFCVCVPAGSQLNTCPDNGKLPRLMGGGGWGPVQFLCFLLGLHDVLKEFLLWRSCSYDMHPRVKYIIYKSACFFCISLGEFSFRNNVNGKLILDYRCKHIVQPDVQHSWTSALFHCRAVISCVESLSLIWVFFLVSTHWLWEVLGGCNEFGIL